MSSRFGSDCSDTMYCGSRGNGGRSIVIAPSFGSALSGKYASGGSKCCGRLISGDVLAPRSDSGERKGERRSGDVSRRSDGDVSNGISSGGDASSSNGFSGVFGDRDGVPCDNGAKGRSGVETMPVGMEASSSGFWNWWKERE